jgi:nicotinate-nucleotide adenylyltransferase
MCSPEKGERWGILGGSFDPVHLGHINLATEIKKAKQLDGILFVLSNQHPFKKNQTVASFVQRKKMLELAVDNIDNIDNIENIENYLVSSIEKDKNLSGYTLDTIKALKNMYPDVKFYFIVGADNLLQIDKWHKPDEIFKELKILSGRRPSYANETVDTKWIDKIEFINTSEVNVSSSELRKMLKNKIEKDNLNKLIDKKVLEYIIENRLYI